LETEDATCAAIHSGIMEPQPDPPVVRNARNRGERAAQIRRIQERLDGLGRSAHHVAAELVVLAGEIKRVLAGGAWM